MLQPATIIRRMKARKLWLTWVMATRAGMISWGSERKRRNKSTRALSAALFALPNCKLCCPFPAEPGSSWDVPDEQDASCHCCAWCATPSPFCPPHGQLGHGSSTHSHNRGQTHRQAHRHCRFLPKSPQKPLPEGDREGSRDLRRNQRSSAMSPRTAGLCPGDVLAGWQRCRRVLG